MRIMNCKKECRRRDNQFGVTWCIDCGKLFSKPSGKSLTAIKVNGIFKPLILALILTGCGTATSDNKQAGEYYVTVTQKVIHKTK